MIEHLLQGLYGVDAPAHFSAPLPKPITGFKGGGLRNRGRDRGYGRKLQKGKAGKKLKGNENRKEKGRERGTEIVP